MIEIENFLIVDFVKEQEARKDSCVHPNKAVPNVRDIFIEKLLQ